MAAKPAPKRIVRIVSGLLPSLSAYHVITIYADNSIRIERPFCQIEPRKEWATIEESEWKNHYHLLGLLERNAYTDTTFNLNQ